MLNLVQKRRHNLPLHPHRTTTGMVTDTRMDTRNMKMTGSLRLLADVDVEGGSEVIVEVTGDEAANVADSAVVNAVVADSEAATVVVC